MKKLFLFIILFIVILFSFSSVKAMTENQKQILIAQIKAQIIELQRQLAIELQKEKLLPGSIKIYGPNNKTGTISVNSGDSVYISWEGKNVDYCTASGNWSGLKNVSGTEFTGPLISSKIYNISCKDFSGKVVASSLTINIVMQSVSIKANGNSKTTTIASGKSATLSWTAVGVKSCFASGDWLGEKNLTGSESTGFLSYARSYIYGITCSSNNGNISDAVVVNVTSPTVNIKANNSEGPLTIDFGKLVTLSWTSSGVVSCTGLGSWSGKKAVSGTESLGNVYTNSFYVLNCLDSAGNNIGDFVTVNVK